MITNKRKRCRAVPTALDDFVNIPKLMNGMLKQKRTSEMCSRRWGAILSISERRGGMENFSSYSGGDSIEPSRNSSGNSSNNNNKSKIKVNSHRILKDLATNSTTVTNKCRIRYVDMNSNTPHGIKLLEMGITILHRFIQQLSHLSILRRHKVIKIPIRLTQTIHMNINSNSSSSSKDNL
mmetsp:Transcript_26015/g.52740  ORF Transcript_26015/g.52740 Transcript_26015/m.52740 type:complete len:180 (+) Transcript_26015:134-673(+)